LVSRARILVCASLAALTQLGTAAAVTGPLAIGWSDLRPVLQPDAAPPAPSAPAKAGETPAADLQGKTVQLSGYLLPSDREGNLVYQFVLIPWTGLCSHMPLPPANQAVLVTLKDPYTMSEIYEPVAVTGTLVTDPEKTQLFILDGVSVIESDYRLRGPQVTKADGVTGAPPPPPANPWSFIRK